ncbi:hypothetical protein [Mesorhizobium abyssinicae]|uniref:hypothetical protein n=1 Tax=Mesorhizobium abyssinicae TaxID=1209958 RepID=UPI00347E0837
MPVKASEKRMPAHGQRIIPATVRDLSYIADCQLDHWTPALPGLKRCRALPMSPSSMSIRSWLRRRRVIGAGMRG